MTTLGLKPGQTKKRNALKPAPKQAYQRKTAPKQSSGRLDKKLSCKRYQYSLPMPGARESEMFAPPLQRHGEKARQEFFLHSFGHPLMRKALNCLPFYRFTNLKKYFPAVGSLSEFIASDHFLKPVKITFSGTTGQLRHLGPEEKLRASLRVLDKISKALDEY